MSVGCALVSVSLQGIGMFAIFTKFASMFNPSKIASQMRNHQRIQRLNRHWRYCCCLFNCRHLLCATFYAIKEEIFSSFHWTLTRNFAKFFWTLMIYDYHKKEFKFMIGVQGDRNFRGKFGYSILDFKPCYSFEIRLLISISKHNLLDEFAWKIWVCFKWAL